MLQWFLGKKQKGVAWLLLFLMCFSALQVPMIAEAAILKTGLLRTEHDPVSNDYYVIGRHNFVDGKVWTYRTKAFTVANKRCADISNPPATVKTARLAIMENNSELEVSGMDMYTKSTYVVQGYDLASAFQKMYEKEIKDAVDSGQRSYTASLYFNSIFQVVYRTEPGKTGNYSGAPMYPRYSFFSQEYHTASAMANNPYVTSWSEADFAGFYNYEYPFTVNIFETKINYVDKKTGKDLVASADAVYGLYRATMSYTLPEKEIEVYGKRYVYDGTFAIDYKNGYNPVLASSLNGVFGWTQNDRDMEIDVYFKEDDSKKQVPVKINIETSRNGTDYRTVKSFDSAEKIYSKEKFTYTSDAMYQDEEGNNYTYAKKWYYTYTDPDGNSKKVDGKTGDYPSIYPVPEVRDGTYLDVYVRYILEDEPIPTPTEPTSMPPSSIPAEPTSPPPTSTPAEPTGPLPTPAPTEPAEPSPTPTPMPEKAPSSNQEAPPNEGSLSRDVATPTSAAIIQSEVKFNRRYDAEHGGIATQEDLYAEGTASEFTLGYDLYHVTGTKTYPITVKKTYILQWEGPDPEETEGEESGGREDGEEEEKEPEILTEEVTLTTTVNVTRGYGYWEIGSFEYYIADSLKLHNYALPNGTITMPVIQSKISPPAAYSGDYPDNMDDPDAYKYGIVLSAETITGDGKDKPVIPRKAFETLAYNAAHEQTGNVKVRNDYLYYWNGTVLDASWTEYNTQTVNPYPLNRYIGETLGGIFYQGEMVIDATKDNGTHQSSGLITYKASPASVSAGSSKTYILTNGPNPVILHTPVYCKGVITEDNDKYVQKSDTIENIVHLVLDEESTLNDFNVRVDNTGPHIQQQGFFTRDYSRILRLPDSDLSNIEKDAYGNLRNDVKFPFDVYMDVGNDYDTSNDVFYHAGTWFTLGRVTQRFYLPLTVREGIYAAEFRTIAVNANGRLKNTQANANTDGQYYVAADSVPIEVSGRLYGLNVYDITDYPIWEEVFRIPGQLHLKLNHQDRYPLGVYSDKYSADKSYNYTVGTKDQYGNETGRSRKYTLPLVGGSHPRYGNIGILKRGYTVRFSVDTIGTYYNDSASVVATPTYYWVDKNGQNRTKVDMYYSAEVQGKSRALIKSGESIDLANVVRYTAGDRKLAIPEDELSITAAIRNLFEWQWEWYNDYLVYGTARTQMGYVFRTFTGNRYADSILSGPNKNRVLNAGITKADLTITKQSWYGETFIPGTARFVDAGVDVFGYAKRQGIDYTESFWKKDGYIIMNLDIRAYQSPGEEYLSYTNRQNEDKFCNMWKLEGGQTAKSDKGRVALYFEPGDFMIYSVEQSAIDDYVVGGIY